MNKQIQILDKNYNESTKIRFSDSLKQEIWQQVKSINNEITRHRSYLNLIARKVFLSWLSLMLDQDFADEQTLNDNVSIWEFINGNAIAINETNIVLIPMETDDKSEISLPEEWVRILSWLGSYYVFLEVNLVENYLDCWGYSSSQNLINNSQLDVVNYVRDLEYENLESDINNLILEYEYQWGKIPQLENLPVLNQQQKSQLVTQLKDELLPRYVLDFSQWLTIISDRDLRQNLYDARQPINLSQWLNNKIELTITKGWHNAQDLITELFASGQSLQPAFAARHLTLSLEEALSVIEQNQDTEAMQSILSLIPNLANSDRSITQITKILTNLIENNNDDEIRWSTALALEKLDIKHRLSPYWFNKEINLLGDIDDEVKIGLLVGIIPKSAEQLSIFVRLYNLEKDSYLPNNLQLQIIDENENIYQSITSSEYDNIIQYKFWGNKGEKFTLKILMGSYFITENFTI